MTRWRDNDRKKEGENKVDDRREKEGWKIHDKSKSNGPHGYHKVVYESKALSENNASLADHH